MKNSSINQANAERVPLNLSFSESENRSTASILRPSTTKNGQTTKFGDKTKIGRTENAQKPFSSNEQLTERDMTNSDRFYHSAREFDKSMYKSLNDRSVMFKSIEGDDS